MVENKRVSERFTALPPVYQLKLIVFLERVEALDRISTEAPSDDPQGKVSPAEPQIRRR